MKGRACGCNLDDGLRGEGDAHSEECDGYSGKGDGHRSVYAHIWAGLGDRMGDRMDACDVGMAA